MKIITGIFDAREPKYDFLSKVFLYSIQKNTRAKVTVYHTDLPSDYQSEIHDRVPGVTFAEMDFKSIRGIEKASQKMFLWDRILSSESEEELVLMDCDMLVLKDFAPVFKEDFDLAYTVKDFPSDFHINTGIIMIKNRKQFLPLWTRWMELLGRVLGDPISRERARVSCGAADQYSLSELVGVMAPLETKSINGTRVTALPSSVYNLHKRWEDLNENTCIVHYKSDWAQILGEIGPYREILLKYSWHLGEAEKWEAAYQIWKQYEEEYRLL